MKCIVCNNTEFNKFHSELIQCSPCTLVFYDKTIDDLELNQLYQKDFFKGEEYFDYESDQHIFRKNFSARLNDIKHHISHGKLFEIGCAYGFFLDLARNFFDVEGIDIAREPTEFARSKLGLNVQTGNYLEFLLPEKQDIFCMWDTIEHLKEPHLFVEKISSEIRTGGYLFLTTGDIGSLNARWRGPKWRMIHPPSHLFYFSRQTITQLLSNYGFRVVNIKYPGYYRSLSQMIYSTFFLNRRLDPLKVKKALKIIDFSIYLNLYDIMLVAAQKI
jgi:2-polyprenyl-3-methyl-5-hydroxy-6-metoxy-1,4-benzoquinol methylase